MRGNSHVLVLRGRGGGNTALLPGRGGGNVALLPGGRRSSAALTLPARAGERQATALPAATVFSGVDIGMMSQDNTFMRRAIELALLAEQEGNLPVGAVITLAGEIVAEGRSAIWVPKFDASRHAEMEALRAVATDLWLSSEEMSLYTTLEPCLMCCGSILLHRIGRVVFGSSDSYGGASTVLPHLPPFFQERIEHTQWLGPIMPAECDPLHKRLKASEGARRGRN